PPGRQRRLRLLPDLWHRACGDGRRTGEGDRDPGVQSVERQLPGARPRRLGGPVGDPDGDRHRAHRRAVPLDRATGAVLMVERRPWLTFFAHATLIVGAALIAMPVYMTFVASTHDTARMLQAPA